MNTLSLSTLPARGDSKTSLKALTHAPALAWPTVAVFVSAVSVMACCDTLALRGLLPLWAACLLNSLAGYSLFSVVHDSIHRAVSSNSRLNDWFGRIAIVSVSPMVTLGLFRWGHIQHHRFANGPRDPDAWLHGPAWSLPLRWVLIDVWYFLYILKAIRGGDKVAARHFKPTLVACALTVLGIVLACRYGYGMDLLVLYFLPARLTLLLLGFSFFWLPHVPHDTPQEQNLYRATTVRLGLEWLMTPLLQNQNFHLLHHLYPSTPFYNNGRLWRLLEPELRRHDLAIQHGFAIQPIIHRGSAPQERSDA
jgi:beta-carotene hydroxylase